MPAGPHYQNRERGKKWWGDPSLSVYHLSDLFRDPLEMPEAQANQPHSLGLETENFSFPIEAEMCGAVPSETLIQLVLDAHTHSNNSSERELPAFSTANYRRQSLRMFCKPQRETAEVSTQSQRNLICALSVLTLQLLLACLHLVPQCAPALALRPSFPLKIYLVLFFPSLFGAFEKGNRRGKYFFPQQFSILRLVPKPRGEGGRAGADGGRQE